LTLQRILPSQSTPSVLAFTFRLRSDAAIAFGAFGGRNAIAAPIAADPRTDGRRPPMIAAPISLNFEESTVKSVS
jgi:hypothetical protein